MIGLKIVQPSNHMNTFMVKIKCIDLQLFVFGVFYWELECEWYWCLSSLISIGNKFDRVFFSNDNNPHLTFWKEFRFLILNLDIIQLSPVSLSCIYLLIDLCCELYICLFVVLTFCCQYKLSNSVSARHFCSRISQ